MRNDSDTRLLGVMLISYQIFSITHSLLENVRPHLIIEMASSHHHMSSVFSDNVTVDFLWTRESLMMQKNAHLSLSSSSLSDTERSMIRFRFRRNCFNWMIHYSRVFDFVQNDRLQCSRIWIQMCFHINRTSSRSSGFRCLFPRTCPWLKEVQLKHCLLFSQ